MTSIPGFHFDSDLRDVPNNLAEWESYLLDQQEKMKSAVNDEERLSLYEMAGISSRILMKLDKAEFYLMKSLALSYKGVAQSRILQNLIRLAHVYQWQREFKKAAGLFDQAKEIMNASEISDSLRASYHQHLGKLFFDQKFYGLAYGDFSTSYFLRQRNGAEAELLESSAIAISEALKRWNKSPAKGLVIRKAVLTDAEGIHQAHMRSIQEICAKDYSEDAIQAWGYRPYSEEARHSAIKDSDVWVIECQGKIEGYAHMKHHFKNGWRIAHVFGLYITPQVLGRSVGKTAMQIMLECMKSREVKEVRLESTISAKDFYKSVGFKENGPQAFIKMSGVDVPCQPMRMEIG
ncbi:hypothetical protein AZI86_05175 [Bdellovibrio bacteriovorus]|uniref:N-acetyltransferase domain-containing protein n=1 Tax=Bdellovibrio bacteriovorus TaxID=959 RepID=A0A150WPK9_BDEBC|nr:GNAT family N-acetyltransferase [Bdellovibrio bacteriovorus]KYG66441.1 hypothetical protein AZI86_05175 [Bdellovibrio bacteriovorus]